MPAALTRTRISSGPGFGAGNSRNSSGLPGWIKRTVLMGESLKRPKFRSTICCQSDGDMIRFREGRAQCRPRRKKTPRCGKRAETAVKCRTYPGKFQGWVKDDQMNAIGTIGEIL